MKTDNLNRPGEAATARTRGHVGPRAGSAGIILTDSTTEVDDVTTLQGYGGTVSGDDGTAQLSYQSIVAYLLNDTGADLPAGSVVVVDTANDSAVTTTTSAQSTLKVGVALDVLPDGAVGPVIIGGYVPLLLVTASVTRGHYLETSTTAGQATANSARRAGSFGQLLTGGTEPTAILFDSPDSGTIAGHRTTHESGGSDAIKLDDLAAPDDNTDLNATTGAHGLLRKLDGSTSKVLRGDGTWGQVISGTGVAFRGAQCRNNGTQTIATATDVPIAMDTENYDTDAYHFTSAANVTGTVAKSSGSAAIVGTGTSFTTELSVNQIITIPGTTTEWFVVTVITDNTHITVSRNAVNSASGQTAKRRNDAIAIPAGLGGYYDLYASGLWDTNATGARTIKFYTTGTDNLLSHVGIYHAASQPSNSLQPNVYVGTTTPLLEGDVVAGIVRHASGSDRTFGASSPAENSGAVTVAFRGT